MASGNAKVTSSLTAILQVLPMFQTLRSIGSNLSHHVQNTLVRVGALTHTAAVLLPALQEQQAEED